MSDWWYAVIIPGLVMGYSLIGGIGYSVAPMVGQNKDGPDLKVATAILWPIFFPGMISSKIVGWITKGIKNKPKFSDVLCPGCKSKMPNNRPVESGER